MHWHGLPERRGPPKAFALSVSGSSVTGWPKRTMFHDFISTEQSSCVETRVSDVLEQEHMFASCELGSDRERLFKREANARNVHILCPNTSNLQTGDCREQGLAGWLVAPPDRGFGPCA